MELIVGGYVRGRSRAHWPSCVLSVVGCRSLLMHPRQLIRRLRADRVAEVAIERPDGVVVDALLAGGLTVVVISPKQIKNLRGRYGSAGNKDDRFDAELALAVSSLAAEPRANDQGWPELRAIRR